MITTTATATTIHDDCHCCYSYLVAPTPFPSPREPAFAPINPIRLLLPLLFVLPVRQPDCSGAIAPATQNPMGTTVLVMLPVHSALQLQLLGQDGDRHTPSPNLGARAQVAKLTSCAVRFGKMKGSPLANCLAPHSQPPCPMPINEFRY